MYSLSCLDISALNHFNVHIMQFFLFLKLTQLFFGFFILGIIKRFNSNNNFLLFLLPSFKIFFSFFVLSSDLSA